MVQGKSQSLCYKRFGKKVFIKWSALKKKANLSNNLKMTKLYKNQRNYYTS